MDTSEPRSTSLLLAILVIVSSVPLLTAMILLGCVILIVTTLAYLIIYHSSFALGALLPLSVAVYLLCAAKMPE